MSEMRDRTVIEVYEQHGATWAGLRGDQLAEGPWLDRFCALLPVGAAVLDIGCGSGVPIARELVRRSFDVTGLDGSAAMLTLFRRNLPDQPAILSDMRQLSLDRRFGGLIPGTVSFTCRLRTSTRCSPASAITPCPVPP